MKTTLLIALFFMFNVTNQSCSKYKLSEEHPKCLEKLIKEFDKNQTCDKGVRVEEYIFQEKTVYVFDPGTCGADMMSTVYSNECQRLGGLGGIAGNGTINGENFENAKFVSIVWER